MSLQPPENLTREGFELRQRLVNDKDTLIAIFEELFSPHLAQAAAMYPSSSSFAKSATGFNKPIDIISQQPTSVPTVSKVA
jgi:hypothetical protein